MRSESNPTFPKSLAATTRFQADTEPLLKFFEVGPRGFRCVKFRDVEGCVSHKGFGASCGSGL